MQAAPEDRMSEPQPRPAKTNLAIPLIVAGLILVAGGAWLWLSADEPPPPPVEPPAPVPEVVVPELPPAPDIPEPVAAPDPEPMPETPPPTNEELDAALAAALAGATESPLFAQLLLPENLVDRSAALIDGLSNGNVLRKFLPMPALNGAFVAVKDGDKHFMSPAGYARYDGFVAAIEALDTAVLVAAFHEFRARFESAYAGLGLDAGEFDNSVIRSLDRVLATPELTEAIELEQKSVMYTYADPRLESLDGLQKQLLRMGPDNVKRLKAKAGEIRNALLQPSS